MPKKKSSYARGGLFNSTTPVFVHNSQELSLGGILGEVGVGAGSGALGGAAFGGIGALPGALIGGGVGLIKGLSGHFREKKENEAMEALLAQQEEVEQPIIPNLESTRTFQSSVNIPTFQLGGAIQPTALEQPPEEKAIDKMLVDLDGPIHEDGGIDLAGNKVEGGETMFRFKGEGGKVEKFIFTDTLLVPDTEDSFAKRSKSIDKRFSRRPDSDRITNRSKERELKGLMALQIPLTLEAEEAEILRMGGSLRGKSLAPTFDTGSNIFMSKRSRSPLRHGGRMYQFGGLHMPTLQAGINTAQGLTNLQGLNPGGMNFSGLFDNAGGGGGDQGSGLGRSILGSLPGLLGAAGPLAQLDLARHPAEQVEFERTPLPGAAQFVDPTQTLRGIGETFGGVRQGIRETASRPGQSITGQIAAGTREAQAVGDVGGRFANINAQIANRRQELKSGIQGRNALIGRSQVLTNMASRGARESARIDAITSLGNIGGQFSRDVRQNQAQNRQNELMQVLLQNAFANLGYSNGQFTT